MRRQVLTICQVSSFEVHKHRRLHVSQACKVDNGVALVIALDKVRIGVDGMPIVEKQCASILYLLLVEQKCWVLKEQRVRIYQHGLLKRRVQQGKNFAVEATEHVRIIVDGRQVVTIPDVFEVANHNTLVLLQQQHLFLRKLLIHMEYHYWVVVSSPAKTFDCRDSAYCIWHR